MLLPSESFQQNETQRAVLSPAASCISTTQALAVSWLCLHVLYIKPLPCCSFNKIVSFLNPTSKFHLTIKIQQC